MKEAMNNKGSIFKKLILSNKQRSKKGKILFFLLYLLIVSAISIVYAIHKNTVNIDVKDVKNVADFMKVLNKELPILTKKYSVPGVSIAFVEDGKIANTLNYGYSDKENGIKMNKDTVFQGASISKPLTAWGIMKLVEQGKINLDDPAEKYLTRWHFPASQYDKNKVTIRRLLSHTGGVSLNGYAGHPENMKLPTLEQSLSGQTNGCGDVRIISEPGTQFMYSGGGYTVLQLIIEEVTGQSFSKYMEENILQPLGMKSSSFYLNDDLKSKKASPYGIYGEKYPSYLFVEQAAGGIYSTAVDLANFACATINNNSILKKESIDLMLKPVMGHCGLGYAIDKLSNGNDIITIGGTHMGWQSDGQIIPQKKSGIIVLSNCNGGMFLNTNILGAWTKWQTGLYPEFLKMYDYERIIVLSIALILAAITLAFALSIITSFRHEKRTIVFLENVKTIIFRMAISIVLLGFTGLWWVYWWTNKFRPLREGLWLPKPFLSISILISIISILGVILNVFPKVNHKKLKD